VVELPVAEVAERSGVNRATVYRWWPTQTALVNDALNFHTRHRTEAPDTGTWAGDVRALMTQIAALLDGPVERALIATMATRRYPAFNELMRSSQRRSLPAWHEAVARAIDRGEVSQDLNAGAVLTMIISPLVTISLFEERRVTAREIDMFAELVRRATLHGAEASAPDGDGPRARSKDGSARQAPERKPAARKPAARTPAARQAAKVSEREAAEPKPASTKRAAANATGKGRRPASR
jgi:AcrR family transcriptional regulator